MSLAAVAWYTKRDIPAQDGMVAFSIPTVRAHLQANDKPYLKLTSNLTSDLTSRAGLLHPPPHLPLPLSQGSAQGPCSPPRSASPAPGGGVPARSVPACPRALVVKHERVSVFSRTTVTNERFLRDDSGCSCIDYCFLSTMPTCFLSVFYCPRSDAGASSSP